MPVYPGTPPPPQSGPKGRLQKIEISENEVEPILCPKCKDKKGQFDVVHKLFKFSRLNPKNTLGVDQVFVRGYFRCRKCNTIHPDVHPQ